VRRLLEIALPLPARSAELRLAWSYWRRAKRLQVRRSHYRRHQRGGRTSTTAVASIYAWTRGLAHRAKLGGNGELAKFAATLGKVTVGTVEAGFMTKDLALLIGPEQKWLTTTGFLDKVADNLNKVLA